MTINPKYGVFLPDDYEYPFSKKFNESDYAARVTTFQFEALGWYCQESYQDKDMYLQYIKTLKQRDPRKINKKKVKSQLVNSWNTEKLLRLTAETFQNNSDSFILQWAFPQAYYAVFNSTLAFFEVAGHSEDSHTKVRAKIGELASSGKYPSKLCLYADGAKKNLTVKGITCSKENFQAHKYNPNDINNLKCHIHTYFESTRGIYLKDRREVMKKDFKTTAKKNKKQLSSAEWDKVSEQLKKTSWLCLLYRKRIKANYRDIDTFLSDELDLKNTLNALIKIVNVLNFTNEINIYKAIGKEIVEWSNNRYDFLPERINKIQSLILK